MCRIICLANQKGGVSKTTTALALAAGLSGRGHRVLGVDLDPQGNFTVASGVDPLTSPTIYEVFAKKTGCREAIVKSPLGYDVIPSGLSLAGADMEFTQTGREFMLQEALENVKEQYDYICIDTQPTLGILTIAALTASSGGVIVPLGADIYSLQGLSQLSGVIENVRKYCNRDLKILGLLITKFNSRQNISKTLAVQIENAAEQLGTKVFRTKIRESVAVKEVALMQGNIFTEAPRANATVDYNDFINELLDSMDIREEQ